MKDLIANIFELWGGLYLDDFSKYMYKADLYGEIALIVLLVPLAVFFIYYKPLDHIKLAKRSIWFCIVLVVSIIVALISWNISYSGIDDYLISHKITKTGISDMDYFWFSSIVFIYTAIVSFIFSLLFKFGASKTRNIPF